MEQKAQQCAHSSCKCSVTEGKRYCSEYCEKHAREVEPAAKAMCGCGHPACGGTVSAS